MKFFCAFTFLLSFSMMVSSQDENRKEPLFTAPIGVQAYSFRNYFPKDIPGTLDRIQAMGITEIEGGGGRIPPEEYRKMCEARGISISSTGTNFNELKENPLEVANVAMALGAKFVMCAWIPHTGDEFTKENADEAIQVFNAAGKVLSEHGLTFCYHPHGYEFQPYEGGTLLDYIIKNTTPEYVSFEMDTYWIWHGGGDPVNLMKKYGDRWKLMHLKDMAQGTPKNFTGHADVETNVPLGTGELDMPGILMEAQKIGIKHYFIEDESSAVFDQVPKSIAFLRSLRK